MGCHDKEILEKWLDHLEKAHEYTKMHEERFKQAMNHNSSTYSVMNSVMVAESALEEVVLWDLKPKEQEKKRDLEERKNQQNFRPSQLSSKNASVISREKVSLSSFKILKEIGSGSFGKVYKVIYFPISFF